MEEKILTSDQKRAIKLIGENPAFKNFYLSGGTVLAAFYLKHRYSDDLDFFTEEEINSKKIYEWVKKAKKDLNAKSVRFEKLYDRYQFFFEIKKDELKLEFTKYPFRQLEKPSKKNEIRIDSFRDIAANKLMAMLERFDPKDFVDLYFILKKRSLDKVQKDVEKKFGIKIDNIFLGGELSKVRRIEAFPKMIKKVTIKDLKDFFSDITSKYERKIFE